MSKLRKGTIVTYKNHLIGCEYEAKVVRLVEGWPELLFSDESTCIVRPSNVTVDGAPKP